MESPRGKGKRGARTSGRSQQLGDTHHLLGCPHCPARETLIVPYYVGRPTEWELRPMLACPGCGRLSATSQWRVIAASYRPLPAASA